MDGDMLALLLILCFPAAAIVALLKIRIEDRIKARRRDREGGHGA